MNKIRQEINAAAIGPMLREPSGECSRCFSFAPQFTGFAGHFPGYPIVPAVVQLLVAQSLAEEFYGSPLRLRSVENAKFLHQLRPGQEVRVLCRSKDRPEGFCFDVQLSMGETRVASFVLCLERPEQSL